MGTSSSVTYSQWGGGGRGRCYSVTNCKWEGLRGEGAVIQLPIVNGGGGAEGRGRCYSVTNCKWEGLRALLFSYQL